MSGNSHKQVTGLLQGRRYWYNGETIPASLWPETSEGPVQQPQVKVTEYADELIATPRAHLRLVLEQNGNGLVLSHEDHALIECPLTEDGMLAAGFVAQALGVKLPPLGESVSARVSTGVLFRVLGVAGLDYKKDESYVLLERLLEEAERQRGSTNESV